MISLCVRCHWPLRSGKKTTCSLACALSSLLPFLGKARFKAMQDLRELAAMVPVKARALIKNQESELFVADLKEGDLVKVKAGEVIPVDGAIVTGATSVDESALTAEQTILFKQKGDSVTGGTLNRDGPITVKLVHNPDVHFLSRILRDLRLALQKTSSPRMAGILGKLARKGVIIQTLAAARKLGRMNTLFFNKTGTLTKGKFAFSELFLERDVNQGNFLSALFSLEAHSDHELARGVQTHPWFREVAQHPVKDFKIYPGLGVSGIFCERGKPERFIAAGNVRFLKRLQMQGTRDIREKIEELESMGDTVIVFGGDGVVRGLMSLADTPRPDVKPLLTSLKKLKVSAIMVTGDHDELFSHLAHTEGLKQIYTRCLPEEKASKIQARKAKKDIVGMVGSSLDEDVPLRAADVGILIGVGTSFPETPPPVMILGKSLLKIAEAIHEAR